MPANNASNGGITASTTSATSKRFELPALDFQFGSLTDGTDIPPPVPSPKEEKIPTPTPTRPKTPTKDDTLRVAATSSVVQEGVNGTATTAANGHGTTSPESNVTRKTTSTTTTNAGVKRPLEDVPASPTVSSRGSLRRLLSRTLLNNAYDDDQGLHNATSPTATTQQQQSVSSRPPSRTASTIAEERKVKRSSSWFRRLRSNDNSSTNHGGNSGNNKRSSQVFEEVVKKPVGPPPPMIPELSALETKYDTRLGDDLFKEIK